MKTIRLTSILMGALLLAFSCKKAEDVGSLTIKMTDSPGDYTALNLQITGIDIYSENSGWITVSNETWLFNVLSLTNGKEISLAAASNIKAGKYTKLKLKFGAENKLSFNTHTTVGGISTSNSSTVYLLWHTPREVVIEINSDVSVNKNTEILLDFHVAQSIQNISNQYFIAPVITVIYDVNTGIRGETEAEIQAFVEVKNNTQTYNTYTDVNGRFLVRGLKEGHYTVTIIPESGLSKNAKTYTDVIVSKGEIHALGTVQF
ncbi:MAG: DUF4382 domain-containing protein [Flavobacteriales bacterium]